MVLRRNMRWWNLVILLPILLIAAIFTCQRPQADTPLPSSPADSLIPKPVSLKKSKGVFHLSSETKILFSPATAELAAIGQYLRATLSPATGYALPVAPTSTPLPSGGIHLTLSDSDPDLGEEGYRMEVSPDSVDLTAFQPAGLFRGVQTLRQLLPPEIEAPDQRVGPWPIQGVSILDYPRFTWRGAMLDVARSFFSVAEVKQYIDYLALYKINRLHLHLSDDQGWRIMINSWPQLATHGGVGAVTGGRPGYFSQEDYAEIIAYAEYNYITVIPEIDMPSHTNAALASYPQLNSTGEAPPLYSGIEVGFSSLAINEDITYEFISAVLAELAAITPGPYLHIGGDEAASTTSEDYVTFITRVQDIVAGLNKNMVGWGEIVNIDLLPSSVVQHWQKNDDAQKAVRKGAQVVMSPAHHVYMDMKYNNSTPLGLKWAGPTEVNEAYQWEPTEINPGVTEKDILGVEAPLWTETIRTMADIEYMIFPRLAGHAEIGWSPQPGRAWDEYRLRLVAHGRRWAQMGINYYLSPQVPWQ